MSGGDSGGDRNKVKKSKVKKINITPLEAVTQNQTDQDFLNFCNYISKLEKVRDIEHQITFDNFVKLKKNYPKDLIGDKLEELNNWLLDPNVPNSEKKKKSVYHLMVNTWLKNKY